MNWKRLLAYITCSVELLLRNDYLATENRILRNQIKGRLHLNGTDRITLAEIGRRLGRKALEEVVQIVRPETTLAWHRRLIAKKFNGSKMRSSAGRPRTDEAIEELILKMARENRSWGYRRIVGALSNLGHAVSHQTVANVLERHGLLPAPERERKTSWRKFIRSHTEVLAAVDFFTAEVWTCAGIITYYVLAFMRVGSRQVCIAGMTPSPDQAWMKQMARNMTWVDTGFLCGCRYLLHDRDAKFCSGLMRSSELSASKQLNCRRAVPI